MWEKRKLRDELILTREICSHTRRGERSSVFSFRWLTLIWTTAVGALHRRPLETILSQQIHNFSPKIGLYLLSDSPGDWKRRSDCTTGAQMAGHARTARARSTRPGHGAGTRTWTGSGSETRSIEIIVSRKVAANSRSFRITSGMIIFY